MSHLKKYTNNIDLEKITEYNINGKNFLEILRIALQKELHSM
ncbi:3243_t:CDS:2 [Rhizophagus irregularis]|nr:3243_t:CDS:2 [Rhizophagus irregularis]